MKKKKASMSDDEIKAWAKVVKEDAKEDAEAIDALWNTPYDLDKELADTRKAIRLTGNHLMSQFFQKVLRNRVLTGDLKDEIKDFPEFKGAMHICSGCGAITMNYFSQRVTVGCMKGNKLNICTEKCRESCSVKCKT